MQPGGPSRQVPLHCGIGSWGQWRVQSTGFPEMSSCLCSRDRDSTAHIQQRSMKLHEGGNKRLDFSFSCLAGAPRGGGAGGLCHSQPRRYPVPEWPVQEPSHDKPSQDPAISDGNPFVPARLGDTPSERSGSTCAWQVLVRQSQGCPGKREEGHVEQDISNLAL